MKKSYGEKAFDVINTIGMVIITLITLYPLVYVLFASLSDSNRLLAYNGFLYKPLGFNVDAYVEVLKNKMVISSFFNSTFYVVVGTIISMLITIMGAYALSRKQLWIRKYINLAVVFTMFFGGGLVPTYLLVKGIGLYDTRWAIILPCAVSTYNFIVMKTAFLSCPASLEEAAKIDGANDFRILFQIILPVTKATLAVVTLFYAVNYWNTWFGPSLYLRDRAKYPLQLYLREVLINSSTDSMMSGSGSSQDSLAVSESIKYATVLVSTVPILVVYPFVQKYFVKGAMVGAVKG